MRVLFILFGFQDQFQDSLQFQRRDLRFPWDNEDGRVMMSSQKNASLTPARYSNNYFSKLRHFTLQPKPESELLFPFSNPRWRPHCQHDVGFEAPAKESRTRSSRSRSRSGVGRQQRCRRRSADDDSGSRSRGRAEQQELSSASS